MTHASLFAAFLLLVPLAAQTKRTLPPAFDRIWGGNNGTGTVFGGTKGISQNLYEGWVPAPGLVMGVGFRRTAGITDYAGFTLDFEIVLSDTTATSATLSATFANNLGTNTTAVLPRQMINVPARDRNSPPSAWIEFMSATPWLFQGPNLLIQTKAFATTWTVTGHRPDRTFASTGGEALNFGSNCGAATISSTTTGSYLPGSSLSLTLAGAPAVVPSILLLGVDLTTMGAIPLPLDLGVIGMTNCLLHVAPVVNFPATTDSAGAASMTFGIPAGTPSFPLAFEWFYVDPSAPRAFAMSATNGRYVQIGPRVPGHRYVWDLFDETALTGSLQDGGPVVRVVSVP